MNSNHYALVSANYVELEERVLSCLTHTESTAQAPRMQRWSSSALTLLQNLPRGATQLPSGLTFEQFASTYRSSELTNTTLDEDKTMQEQPQVHEVKINSKAITMQEVPEIMYTPGDVYSLVPNVAEWMHDVARVVHTLLQKNPELTQDDLAWWLLSEVHYSYAGAVFRPSDYARYPIHSGRGDSMLSTIIRKASKRAVNRAFCTCGDDVTFEEVCCFITSELNVNLHKRAIAQVHKWNTLRVNGGHDASRGDWRHNISLAGSLLTTNSLYSNGGALAIGYGFKAGNPMVVLAKPVVREGALVQWVLSEQRMGRFLQGMLGNVDCRDIVEDMKVYNNPAKTYLCCTEKEWHIAYESGPSSCMTGYSFDHSPVRCYADNEKLRLFIVYNGELFGDNFEVQARAVVNIETNEYIRAYGTNSDALLRSNGYSEDRSAATGCLLKRIPHPDFDNAVLMPYLDGYEDNIDLCGDSFVIVSSGEYEAQDASGYIYLVPASDCCCCEDRFPEDSMEYVSGYGCVCSSCLEENFVSLSDGTYVPSEDAIYSDYLGGYLRGSEAAKCGVSSRVLHGDDVGYAVINHSGDECWVHLELLEIHNGDYILTEEACADYGYEYLGNDEAEEAA